jgi:hypothetical protein
MQFRTFLRMILRVMFLSSLLGISLHGAGEGVLVRVFACSSNKTVYSHATVSWHQFKYNTDTRPMSDIVHCLWYVIQDVSFVDAPIMVALSAGTSRDSCIVRGLKMTPCRFDVGVHCGVVVWGSALQVGRSQVRFPIMSLEFFIDIILPAALWPWGRLSL